MSVRFNEELEVVPLMIIEASACRNFGKLVKRGFGPVFTWRFK